MATANIGMGKMNEDDNDLWELGVAYVLSRT